MIIQLQDGREIDIKEYSMKRLFHFIPSITVSHTTDTVDGGIGNKVLDSRFDSRVITVRFLYESYDIQDYYLLRDEINALFTRREYFYIIFKKESYKRYKVRLNGSFLVTPAQYMEQFEVEFMCEDLYGESVVTTLSTKEWDIGKFGWNGAITWDDEYSYSFTSNTFVVKNAGTAPVDPRQSELRVIVRGNFPSGITVTNQTTGDVYAYNAQLTSDDVLILDGVQTFKNGQSAFKDTNKSLISLAPGNNQFVIYGGTVHSIVFDFRFLYL